jgi:hypothetical protein
MQERFITTYCDKQNITINTYTPICPLFRDVADMLTYMLLEDSQNLDEFIGG